MKKIIGGLFLIIVLYFTYKEYTETNKLKILKTQEMRLDSNVLVFDTLNFDCE